MSSVSTVSTTATGGLGGESREPWRWLQWARKPHNNQTQGLFLSSCLLISCVCQRSLMLKFKCIIVFLTQSWFELLKILRILHNWTNRGTLQRSALLISSLYTFEAKYFVSNRKWLKGAQRAALLADGLMRQALLCIRILVLYRPCCVYVSLYRPLQTCIV